MIAKKINKDVKDILKGAFSSFVFQIIGIILSYLFVYMISHYYGAKTMGIYALMFTVLNIIVLFSKFGLDLTIVKFIGEVSETKNFGYIKDIYLKILSMIIPISLLLSVFLYVNASNFANYVFHKPYLTVYIKFISFGILPMTLRIINANALRGLQEIKRFAFLQNVSVYLFAIIMLVFFIFLKKTNDSDLDPIIAVLFGLYTSMLISFYLWLNSAKILFYIKEMYITSKEIFKVSFPLLLTSSIMLVYSMSDVIMLGMFRSEQEVGIYNVDYKIGSAGMIFSMALSSIIVPKIAAAYKENNILKLRANVMFGLKLSFMLSLFTYFLILVFSQSILRLFGEEFLYGELALKLLLIGFFIKSVFGIFGYVLEMTHYQKQLVYVSFLSAIANIALNYFLIPIFGIEGAVIASVISIIVHHGLLIINVKKFLF